MKRIYYAGIAASIGVMSGTIAVSADEAAGRLTAGIGVGAMVIDSGNNLVPGGSSKIIDDLDSAVERETAFVPLLIPSIAYRLNETGETSLFLNTDPPIDEVGSLGINAGISHTVDGTGILEFGTFISPFAEAYKNPYLVGVRRETTSAMQYGVKVAFNRILGSGLRVNAAWMNEDIDDDQIGRMNPAMDRDGNVYSLKTNYSIYLSENLEIRPRFGISAGDYKGEANSYVKLKPGIEINCSFGNLGVESEFFYSSSTYDESNPIFGKTREDDGYGMTLTLYYVEPFGYENFTVVGLAGYSRDDSNINFYDTEAITTGVLVNYDFAY